MNRTLFERVSHVDDRRTNVQGTCAEQIKNTFGIDRHRSERLIRNAFAQHVPHAFSYRSSRPGDDVQVFPFKCYVQIRPGESAMQQRDVVLRQSSLDSSGDPVPSRSTNSRYTNRNRFDGVRDSRTWLTFKASARWRAPSSPILFSNIASVLRVYSISMNMSRLRVNDHRTRLTRSASAMYFAPWSVTLSRQKYSSVSTWSNFTDRAKWWAPTSAIFLLWTCNVMEV